MQPIEAGTARPVPGLTLDDQFIRWSLDGRAVYVFRRWPLPFRFERVDLATGRRELVREVAPADKTGVGRSYRGWLAEDARFYAYDYQTLTSSLFVVEGAR